MKPTTSMKYFLFILLYRTGFGIRAPTGNRLATGAVGFTVSPEGSRPVTSFNGANYSSHGNKSMLSGQYTSTTQLVETKDTSPEETARDMEKQINVCLEESSFAAKSENYKEALDKAKLAAQKEKKLTKYREDNQLGDQVNFDLKFAVDFNVGYCYELNELYDEALTTYDAIVKNKQYQNATRIKVNAGNIFYKKGDYAQAIKLYKMALDRTPGQNMEQLRINIQRNIGNAYVRSGNYKEAIETYKRVLETGNQVADFQTAYNIIICYYAIDDNSAMRNGFNDLINMSIEDPNFEEEKQMDDDDENKFRPKTAVAKPLEEYYYEYRQRCEKYIVKAAKLIAPKAEETVIKTDAGTDKKLYDEFKGYDYVINKLKEKYINLASELEVCKAVAYVYI